MRLPPSRLHCKDLVANVGQVLAPPPHPQGGRPVPGEAPDLHKLPGWLSGTGIRTVSSKDGLLRRLPRTPAARPNDRMCHVTFLHQVSGHSCARKVVPGSARWQRPLHPLHPLPGEPPRLPSSEGWEGRLRAELNSCSSWFRQVWGGRLSWPRQLSTRDQQEQE